MLTDFISCPYPSLVMVGWLIVFGSTALCDCISVYIGLFPREREIEESNERNERKNVQTTPSARTASAVRPCNTLIQISRMSRHWRFTQHHGTTRTSPSPPPPPKFFDSPKKKLGKRGLFEDNFNVACRG